MPGTLSQVWRDACEICQRIEIPRPAERANRDATATVAVCWPIPCVDFLPARKSSGLQTRVRLSPKPKVFLGLTRDESTEFLKADQHSAFLQSPVWI
jgi:hypothetical protein